LQEPTFQRNLAPPSSGWHIVFSNAFSSPWRWKVTATTLSLTDFYRRPNRSLSHKVS
jgi:hypothetical protein